MRRQIRVLTAEGRLSAWVLTLLPLGIAVYMFAVNPEYIGLLVTTRIGSVHGRRRGHPAGARGLLDEKDRGYRCLRSGSYSPLRAAFFAVVLGGLAVDQTMSDKNRAVRLLESHVSGERVRSTSATSRCPRTSAQRVLVPIVSGAGRIARRITPLDTRDRIAKKIMLAGAPAGWDAERSWPSR